MKDFINYVLPHAGKFINTDINYRDTKHIQEVVMKSFGLKNFKDLRDKFEGLAFLNKFTEKVVGVIGVRKVLQLENIDWESINPKDYKPFIEVEGVKVEVVTSDYGKIPLINANSRNPVIIVLNRENKNISICGFADVKTLKDENNYVSVKSVMTRKEDTKASFIAMEKLKVFNNIEELKTLIK